MVLLLLEAGKTRALWTIELRLLLVVLLGLLTTKAHVWLTQESSWLLSLKDARVELASRLLLLKLLLLHSLLLADLLSESVLSAAHSSSTCSLREELLHLGG